MSIQKMSSLTEARRHQLHCDVVVVGLGAGGSMVFHDLVRSGHDVIALELGRSFSPQDMLGREELMIPQLFAESGTRATDDFGVSIIQGKGVGGSTLHNTNLCKRLPIELLEDWAETYGLHDLLEDSLTRDFEDVERLLNVHRIPDDRVTMNNSLIQRGIDALGYRGGRLAHNRGDLCQQAGLCELGCPNQGKENAEKALIRPVLGLPNARVFSEALVERIVMHRAAATGVQGHAVNAQNGLRIGAFEVQAKHVVLSGSATSSAALVKSSDVPDPHGLAGTNLHMHPGAVVAGVFDEQVEGWLGTPQSLECTEFLEFGKRATKRAWIVSGFAHPGAAAGFLPGFGPAHASIMRQYPHVAVAIVMLHDHVSGVVSPGEGEQVHVHYRLDRQEYAQLALGLREASRILLAAGAKKVMVPLRPARWITHESELEGIDGRDLGLINPSLTAVHPMSTLWLGSDPRRSVVDPRGHHHQVKNLWVADSSLFPTSIGGPPQIPIYTFARRVARHIAHEI